MCPLLSLFRREENRDGDTYESYALHNYWSTAARAIEKIVTKILSKSYSKISRNIKKSVVDAYLLFKFDFHKDFQEDFFPIESGPWFRRKWGCLLSDWWDAADDDFRKLSFRGISSVLLTPPVLECPSCVTCATRLQSRVVCRSTEGGISLCRCNFIS